MAPVSSPLFSGAAVIETRDGSGVGDPSDITVTTSVFKTLNCRAKELDGSDAILANAAAKAALEPTPDALLKYRETIMEPFWISRIATRSRFTPTDSATLVRKFSCAAASKASKVMPRVSLTTVIGTGVGVAVGGDVAGADVFVAVGVAVGAAVGGDVVPLVLAGAGVVAFVVFVVFVAERNLNRSRKLR